MPPKTLASLVDRRGEARSRRAREPELATTFTLAMTGLSEVDTGEHGDGRANRRAKSVVERSGVLRMTTAELALPRRHVRRRPGRRCEAPTADCDESRITGCESNLLSDIETHAALVGRVAAASAPTAPVQYFETLSMDKGLPTTGGIVRTNTELFDPLQRLL